MFLHSDKELFRDVIMAITIWKKYKASFTSYI